mmetsp:Transcript_11712/g.28661  ORF Transcript_11712/g.28661 Transcript_11712/m.28661 type:complete len:110 (+) Transcript_11712:29-358(+)
MANQRVFEELKAALNAAQPGQLNSHSTLKAAEALLGCLRRDGVTAGSNGGAPTFHYGMNYVDGGASQHGTQNSSGGHHHAPSGGYSKGNAEKTRSTEGIMPGSSWSSAY